MPKCKKCSQEFCSSFNYRRHTQVHRQTFNANKEPHKNRQLLAVFWDKLSLEEARDILSFDDVMLKGVPGSTIIDALADLFNLQEARLLPQSYTNAGFILLVILRAKPSLPAISSKELFNALDDASEKTFLCGGTAVVEKQYFVGEDKLLFVFRDLIAVTSFLFEKQLMKAWVAIKDVEALRCHKLLVEEEEAAQKRQAKISRRKRWKKQRQKQKSREHLNEHNGGFNIDVDSVEENPASAQESEPQIVSDIPALAQESAAQAFSDMPASAQESAPSKDSSRNYDSIPKYTEPQSKKPLDNTEAREEHINQEHFQVINPKMVRSSRQRRSPLNHWHEVNLQRERSRSHARNNNVSWPKPMNEVDPFKARATAHKVWIKKLEVSRDEEEILKSRLVQEDTCHPEEEKGSFEMMIGSISVTMRSRVNKQHSENGDKKFFVKTSSGLSDASREAASSLSSLVRPRKLEIVKEIDPSKDQAATNKVLIKKLKVHKRESLKSRLVQEHACRPEEEKGSFEMMIGSISVAVRSSVNKQHDKSGNKKFSLKTTNDPSGAIQQVASRHLKPVNRGETMSTPLIGLKSQIVQEGACPPEEEKGSCTLMIGSISVALKNSLNMQQDKSGNKKFSLKTTSDQSGAITQVASRHLRGVSQLETKNTPLFGKENKFMDKVQGRIATDESSLQLRSAKGSKDDDLLVPDEVLRGNLPLSRAAAIEFLARRWKVANSCDHVVWKRMSTQYTKPA